MWFDSQGKDINARSVAYPPLPGSIESRAGRMYLLAAYGLTRVTWPDHTRVTWPDHPGYVARSTVSHVRHVSASSGPVDVSASSGPVGECGRGYYGA